MDDAPISSDQLSVSNDDLGPLHRRDAMTRLEAEHLDVLVIGGGAIGLLCSLILEKVKNCKDILLSEPNTKRLQVCKNNLNSNCVNPNNKEINENSFDIILLPVVFPEAELPSIAIENE